MEKGEDDNEEQSSGYNYVIDLMEDGDEAYKEEDPDIDSDLTEVTQALTEGRIKMNATSNPSQGASAETLGKVAIARGFKQTPIKSKDERLYRISNFADNIHEQTLGRGSNIKELKRKYSQMIKLKNNNVQGFEFEKLNYRAPPVSVVAPRGRIFESPNRGVDEDDLMKMEYVSPPTIKRPRTNIPAHIKYEIVDFVEKNPRLTQTHIANLFGIDRTTVSKIIKRYKPSLLNTPGNITKNIRTVNYPNTTIRQIITETNSSAPPMPDLSFHERMINWYQEANMLEMKITLDKVTYYPVHY